MDIERACSWCGESLLKNGMGPDLLVCQVCEDSNVSPTEEAEQQYVTDFNNYWEFRKIVVNPEAMEWR